MTERAYRYRFYPTDEQENLLRRTMGCVRLVYNKALATRTEAWYERQERIQYKETSSLLTSWKKSEDLDFLNEVSCVPLQQCLRHLQKAFANFWGKRAKYPRFKKKRNGGSAEFTKSAFKYQDNQLWLAKCKEPLNIVWTRDLPEGCKPSTVTVKLDPSGRWFVSLLIDDYTLEYKCNWFGRKLVKVDRFFPSSKRCNHCGYVVDKLPLNVRSWNCPSWEIKGIDRDINAGKNILAAGLAVIVCGADIRPDRHSSKARQRGLCERKCWGSPSLFHSRGGGLPHERLSQDGQLRKTTSPTSPERRDYIVSPVGEIQRGGRKQKPKS